MSLYKDIYYFYKISRPLNLAISFLSFFIACFIAKSNRHSLRFLADWQFWAVSLVITLIAAGGYWVNDVYDFRIDRINKPERTVVNAFLSVKKVLTAYFVLHFLLFAFCFIWFPPIHILFVFTLAIFLLFIYAAWLKRVSVVGNLVVSFLTALVIITAGYLYGVNTPLTWMIIFAFQINLIREIIKDIEDVKGDFEYKLQTLPIQLGIDKTKWLLYLLFIIFIVTCNLPFMFQLSRNGDFLWNYLVFSVVFVQLPSVYLLIKLIYLKNYIELAFHSKVIKWIMLSGILTILFLK
jgi:4-hydroxybenzoate polyprenyltransferase